MSRLAEIFSHKLRPNLSLPTIPPYPSPLIDRDYLFDIFTLSLLMGTDSSTEAEKARLAEHLPTLKASIDDATTGTSECSNIRVRVVKS